MDPPLRLLLQWLRCKQTSALKRSRAMNMGGSIPWKAEHLHHGRRRGIDRNGNLMPAAVVLACPLPHRKTGPSDTPAYSRQGTDHALSIAPVGPRTGNHRIR